MKTEEFSKCVSELNMDEEAKLAILDSIQKGQLLKGVRILQQYRGEILSELHSDQDKLYQIDFALQKAKEEG